MLSRRRIRLILTLAISGLVLAYWGFQGENYQPETTDRDTSNDIDGFLINSETLQFDETGAAQHRLAAERIDHYPEQDRSKLIEPRMRFFGKDGIDTDAESTLGEIGPNNEVVLLIEDVKITEQKEQGYRVTTDFLRIEPDNDYAETHSPVTLLQAQNRTDSIGMEIYMDQDRVRLLQDVRGHYEPR